MNGKDGLKHKTRAWGWREACASLLPASPLCPFRPSGARAQHTPGRTHFHPSFSFQKSTPSHCTDPKTKKQTKKKSCVNFPPHTTRHPHIPPFKNHGVEAARRGRGLCVRVGSRPPFSETAPQTPPPFFPNPTSLFSFSFCIPGHPTARTPPPVRARVRLRVPFGHAGRPCDCVGGVCGCDNGAREAREKSHHFFFPPTSCTTPPKPNSTKQ